eukprot:COSAG04_NODE_8927_length_916_cov_1.694002_1_plen_46_part_10
MFRALSGISRLSFSFLDARLLLPTPSAQGGASSSSSSSSGPPMRMG